MHLCSISNMHDSDMAILSRRYVNVGSIKEERNLETMIEIFGNAIPLAEKSWDYLWAKQQLHLTNTANVDTPGYKTKYMSFEDLFNSKLKAASATNDRQQINASIENARWQVKDTRLESTRLDENNVDVDEQLIELTRTALQYQYMLHSVNSDFTKLRSVIKGQ